MGFPGHVRMSIVTRIFALIALTLLLVAGGVLFSGLQLRQNRIAELRSDTVQLARIAVDRGKIGVQIALDLNGGFLKLVLQKRERLLNHAVQVHIAQGDGRGAGEIQQ